MYVFKIIEKENNEYFSIYRAFAIKKITLYT